MVAANGALRPLSRLPVRCGTLIPRALAACIALWSIALLSSSSLHAGCHYGHGSDNSGSFDEATERNFHFLGQWIYEGGEIKYVPWQGQAPCDGPNCRAKEQPVTTSLPLNVSVRNCSLLSVASRLPLDESDSVAAFIALDDLRSFSGYPHEHEYPP